MRVGLIQALAAMEKLRTSLALIACGLSACASTPSHDVTPSSIFDGAAFWIYPGEVAKAPFVFRWHGDKAYVSTPANTRPRLISISECPDLKADLARLDASVIPSVQAITTPKFGDPDLMWVGHVRYALKYHADYSVNELRLESYDPSAAPWVAAAVAVKDRAMVCLAGS